MITDQRLALKSVTATLTMTLMILLQIIMIAQEITPIMTIAFLKSALMMITDQRLTLKSLTIMMSILTGWRNF